MKIFFFIIVTFIAADCVAQSDFLVLKKRQHTMKSFFSGSHIAFQTADGYYEGQINTIARDSVYLTEFDIRRLPTQLGVFMTDTVATYRVVFNYKDIVNIGNDQKEKHFSWTGSGGSLLGGGVLITLVGLGTWVFTKPGTQYYASPYVVGGGALLAGIGYLILSSGNKKNLLGKKLHLEYIKVRG